MGSGGGNQTSTSTSYQSPQIGYWNNRLLQNAGPYYLGNLQVPTDLNAQTAPFTPYQNQAFSDISNTTGDASMLGVGGMGALSNLLATNPQIAALISQFASLGQPNGILNSLAQGNRTLMNIGSTGGLPSENTTLSNLGVSNLPGMLSQTISGKYLNPSTNPYLADTFNQAAKGVTDQYQTSIAPSLMAEGEVASGGGPGALANNSAFNQAQWQNQYGLGQTLNNLATDIYGGNYQQERQNQLAAAGQAEGLAGQANQLAEAGVGNQIAANQAQFGNQLAANQTQFGNRLSADQASLGAIQAQQQAQAGALGLLPQTQSSLYAPANQLLQAGTLQQQQQQNVLDTLFQNAMRSATWEPMMLSNFGNLLSQLSNGTGTTITSTPNNAAQK